MMRLTSIYKLYQFEQQTFMFTLYNIIQYDKLVVLKVVLVGFQLQSLKSRVKSEPF